MQACSRKTTLRRRHLRHLAQKFLLQDVFALLVLLASLVRPVVLPAHHLLTLPAEDVSDHMPASSHVALNGLTLLVIDDAVEEVCFAMLATEVLQCESALLKYGSQSYCHDGLTRLMISSWSARCVLHVRQP